LPHRTPAAIIRIVEALDRHPYRYTAIGDFRRRFTRYHEWQRSVIWEGRYVIVSE
jgi:hypothetical protein